MRSIGSGRGLCRKWWFVCVCFSGCYAVCEERVAVFGQMVLGRGTIGTWSDASGYYLVSLAWSGIEY